MAKPISLQIIEEIRNRLYVIQTVDGYNTNAGDSVELGSRQVSPDELINCVKLLVYETEDSPRTDEADVCGVTPIDLSIAVEGHKRQDEKSNAEELSFLWQDIIRSVLIADVTLGGLANYIIRGPKTLAYPQPGGETIGVRQEFTVTYLETFGNP